MKVLAQLDSLDNVKDGETRKLVTKATSSGSGNVVSSVSVSGDTVTYTKGVTALTAHQNAFSNVKVGSTTVAADSAGDTLELVAGSNVTLTPDATNDKVTIAATDTNTTYTIATGDSNGQIKVTPSSGSAYNINVKGLTGLAYKKLELMTTNPFSPSDMTGLYISKIDNAFYALDKRYTISWTKTTTGGVVTTGTSGIETLFDGDYEGGFTISNGDTCTFLLKFGETGSSGYFPGYPYGNILVSFYYIDKPASVSARAYCNYSNQGIGWHDLSVTDISGTTSNVCYKIRNDYYNINQFEITIVGDTTNADHITRVTEIEMHLDRPNSTRNPFVSKYGHETLYYNLDLAKGSLKVQNGYLYGDTGTYTNHAIKLGHVSDDKMNFYEYGGLFNFYKSRDGSNTLLGKITTNGWEGNVVGNLTGTASMATGDKNGNDITTTYYLASNPNGYTSNTGTITKVQANGTDVASSGTANIPAATTSKYGVTELSSATDSTSEALAATPKAVKAAYDLAASKGTGTITGVSVNGTSVATSGVANITSIPASILSGAIPSAVTATTQSAGDNSTKIATTAFVKTAIDNLPDPMVFKGSLGTGGTITALPVDGSASIGDTYKVITAGTYASKAAKVGDTFICLTKTSSANTWELIPSGDEPSGTVTSITIKGSSPITVDSESAITTSGTRTISHANSGVTAGTYRSVTVNATGHVTAGTNPTTLSGYGITDAKIASGVITLGSNTITPLTASSTLDATKVSGTLPTSTYTDTKNTAGSTDSSSKLFLVGATSQAANPQTYSQDTAYVDTNGHLYSNSKQVVNLSDSQALTNKTYNGYTLAAACAKAVVTSIDTSASLPTSNAVKTFVEGKGYVLKSGDTMTGALNFANNVANKVGDDVSFGDFNKAGTLGIIGQNGTTGIALIKNGSTWGASAERAEMVYNSTDKCIEFNFV